MRYFALLLIVFLSACGSQTPAPVRTSGAGPTNVYQPRADFYRIPKQVQCVPYAREISGIPIRGDAHTWWPQSKAMGYQTGSQPRKGAVMVLSKTSRLKYGHLAVVKKIVNSRKIEVAHTNWGGNLKDRCVVYNAMPVIDVSKNNDWSKTRFWHYPSKSFGSIYPNEGFIYQR
ncbi:MAG: CHAP domain-containing protein [Pseudomonadota bacterium]